MEAKRYKKEKTERKDVGDCGESLMWMNIVDCWRNTKLELKTQITLMEALLGN